MKLAWLSDIHLDFVKVEDEICAYFNSIKHMEVDAVVITGDIAISGSLSKKLVLMEEILACPIYFVLGNHDYYYSSIKKVRFQIKELCVKSKYLKWMPSSGIVKLTDKTCLIGYGSWADGRYGNYDKSEVKLNDFVMIEELSMLTKEKRLKVLNDLGDEASNYFESVLPEALTEFEKIIVLTHVPPFVESCLYKNKATDELYLPHFSCKATGDVFLKYMKANLEKGMTVLSGHTHFEANYKPLPNLHVKTGKAEYGQPKIMEVIEVE